MPVQTLCKIVEKTWLNPAAVSMTLEAPGIAERASCGQFVNIKCGEGLLLRRPISICDYQDGLIRIVFEARGEGTAWLTRQKVGTYLDLLGPLGHGFTLTGTGRVLVVGGGIGVPPMLAAAKAAAGRAVACVGFRSKENAMLLPELEAACQAVRVTSDDGTLGGHGFVDALVREELAAADDYTAVLACGPKPMLRSVFRAAKEKGVPCQVSMEERMGCGIGACLVCACKIKKADGEHYLHVCKDGPVFDGEEVCWDE